MVGLKSHDSRDQHDVVLERKYWDRLADSFSEQVIELAQEDLHGVIDEELCLLAERGSSVVDLGCGPGALIPFLTRRFQSVCAVDFSKPLLEKAEAKHGSASVQFIHADLTCPVRPERQFDVTVCSSVLILKSPLKRRRLLESVRRFTRPGGRMLITVPALESSIHVYRTLIDLREELGDGNGLSRGQARRLFAREVPSILDGNVSIQGVPTHHWMREELLGTLKHFHLKVERERRVEFSWSREIDAAPKHLGAPYPWDWLVVAKKPRSKK